MRQLKFKVGSLINGRYEVKNLLGEGGFSTVYHAFDSSLSRDVAIKVLKLGLNDSDIDIERYHREARVLADLHHKNIVSVYAFELFEGHTPLIVMEYLQGSALSNLIAQRAPIEPGLCKNILLQLAEGLSYAHDSNLIHRDLSPANIFLIGEYPDFNVRIIDFGLSKVLTEMTNKLTRTGQLLGSPPYMCPEQLRGLALGPAADIYAFGCIMYEMLSGQQAFKADSLPGILHKHQSEFPPEPDLKKLDPETAALFKAIMLRCLKKQASDRFSSCRQIIQAFNGQLSVSEIINETNLKLESSWSSLSAGKKPASFQTILLVCIVLSAALLSTYYFGNMIFARKSNQQTQIAPASKSAFFERVLDTRESRYGKESRNIIKNLEDLAEAYEHEGRLLDAQPLRERAMSIREREFGAFDRKSPPPSPLRASSEMAIELADNYRLQGKFNKAAILLEELLKYKESLGPENPGLPGTLSCLGSTYLSLGKLEPAEKMLIRACRIREKDPLVRTVAIEFLGGSKGRSYGNDSHSASFSTYMAQDYNLLGEIYRKMKKNNLAREYYEKVLSSCKIAQESGALDVTVKSLRKAAQDGISSIETGNGK